MNTKGMRLSTNIELAPPVKQPTFEEMLYEARALLDKFGYLDEHRDPNDPIVPISGGMFGMTDSAGGDERRVAATMLLMRQFGLTGEAGFRAAEAVLGSIDQTRDSVDDLFDYTGVQWE